MKHLTTLAVLVVLGFTLGAHAAPAAGTGERPKADTEVLADLAASEAAAVAADQWEAFGKSLVRALHTRHQGVRVAALRMVIQYGHQVDVDEAVFDVVRLYRDNKDDAVRRMAVVALGKMQHPWAMDFLRRSARFEQNPAVLHTLRAVVAGYYAGSPWGA